MSKKDSLPNIQVDAFGLGGASYHKYIYKGLSNEFNMHHKICVLKIDTEGYYLRNRNRSTIKLLGGPKNSIDIHNLIVKNELIFIGFDGSMLFHLNLFSWDLKTAIISKSPDQVTKYLQLYPNPLEVIKYNALSTSFVLAWDYKDKTYTTVSDSENKHTIRVRVNNKKQLNFLIEKLNYKRQKDLKNDIR